MQGLQAKFPGLYAKPPLLFLGLLYRAGDSMDLETNAQLPVGQSHRESLEGHVESVHQHEVRSIISSLYL